jgi:hypothetical protein
MVGADTNRNKRIIMSDIFLTSMVGDRDKRFDIPLGQTTVGRSEDANIVLSSPQISRFHALFERNGHAVWLTDLNSTNGTYVNEHRLESNQRVMLYLGDRIRFGGDWRIRAHPTTGELISMPPCTFVIHGIRMADLENLTKPSFPPVFPQFLGYC